MSCVPALALWLAAAPAFAQAPPEPTSPPEPAAPTEPAEPAEPAPPAVTAAYAAELPEEIRRSREELLRLREELEAVRRELRAERRERGPDEGAGGSRVTYTSEIVVDEDDIVDGDVQAYGHDIIVEGRVTGNATALGGDIFVEDGGVIEGDATSIGGNVEIDDEGVVLGSRVELGSSDEDVGWSLVDALSSLWHRAVFMLSFAGAGVLVVGLFPQRIGRIASAMDESPVRTVAVGFSAIVLLGIASVLFALTIIGLPVSFLLWALLGLAWLMGFVGLCQAVGDRLPFEQKHHGRWLAFLVGVLLVSFLGVLPWVGWLLVIGGSVLGVGAAVGTRLGARDL